MEKQETLKRKMIRSIISVFLTGAMLLFATGYSFGWFSSNRRTNGSGISIGLDYDGSPVFTVFTFNTAKEEGADGWIEGTVSGNETFAPVINGFNQRENQTFVVSSLPLGTIDNLVNPKEDNTMYLRFEITPKAIGDVFSLMIRRMESTEENGVPIYPFEVYDKDNQLIEKTKTVDGVEVGNDVYEQMRDVVENENLRLFKLQYYIDGATDPGGITTEPSDAMGDGTLIRIEAESTDPYSLYVKVQPNPNTFAYIAKHLYRYMPCIFLYDFYIEYEIIHSQD